jgi:hypothetical protein
MPPGGGELRLLVRFVRSDAAKYYDRLRLVWNIRLFGCLAPDRVQSGRDYHHWFPIGH